MTQLAVKTHDNPDGTTKTDATGDPSGILTNPVKITAVADILVNNLINMGDWRWQFSTSGDGSQLGTAAAQLLAFWGATPVAQYQTTGTVTGQVSGSGTAVLVDDTFTGNVGATAYTLGDMIRALKKCGIMKA